ncbi:endonuclease/exonuclease/phosphatase family protein [Vreelandella salicampi]|uniref:Endonuclease/exonuclease/phosphatase family protein n=1 Tax=Vreelandella salicampi TaxID=1449798 RepID=A0A7Z0LN61_9GAMM|nr:endonuclease/exonuclease/phosphatase family protein [Halomonas salicampi]NYS62022.1 endonuclease/exonuclease/phosphatase family protein [Halomonas salicampi]
MSIVLVALALMLVIATLLPLLRFNQWWIRVLDFPRAQIATAGIVILCFYLYYWDTQRPYESAVLALLVLAVGYQVVKMLPYTVLMPKQVLTTESDSDDANISLLVANVLMENQESKALLGIVRKYNPDMILTVETDRWWEKALRTLENEYPHTLKHPLDNTYGMLLYSRLELINPDIRFILEDSMPSMHMQVILPSGDRVFMHFVHPDPPNPMFATETTERDAELLIVGREVETREGPTIIAGDFNDVAWSQTTSLFQKTSGLLDPRVGRGMYNSFNAKNPLMRWPLDHVFHSDHFKLVRMERGPAWGSDHFPMFIELSLETGAKADQVEPDTNRAEGEQVDEKIEDGKQQADE